MTRPKNGRQRMAQINPTVDATRKEKDRKRRRATWMFYIWVIMLIHTITARPMLTIEEISVSKQRCFVSSKRVVRAEETVPPRSVVIE